MARYDEIFSINSDAEFEREALRLFRYQAEHCAPYAEYLRLIGVDVSMVDRVESIPMLPIELFKSHKIYCGEDEPQMVFTSSATTGMVQSRHYVEDLELYERSFTEAFRQFYGDPKECSIYALLPSYLEREGSSLVYMAERLIAQSGGGGFYLNDYEKLLADMSRDYNPKILLGVTYALLDLAENYAPHLDHTVVMETGGMKGRRKELPKSELHKMLCSAFGVEKIHSEYGMAELMSQAYSFGDGIFRTPRWMKVLVRDVNNPFARLADGRRGGLDIIDLANRSSCAFIATQDVGIRYEDGSFRIEGRISQSDIRGCNLLVQS
ncbi:MAG: acyltransferase [Alistipes sp.]|nr:acyltransferase [Alistipes sp.]